MKRPGAIIIEGHVQGLSNVRSLGCAGVPVYVVDTVNCIARYSKYCKKFFLCPDFIKDAFADFLMGLAEKEGLCGWLLLPSNDHAVYTLSKNKERLEKYYKVITPELPIVDKIYDKIRLIEIAKQVGVPVPATFVFNNFDDPELKSLVFPLITKGTNGLSFYKAIRKKALLAENEKELINQLKLVRNKYSLEKSFTQELIPSNGINNTISFTAFCVNGQIKTYWMGVKLREHPIRFGTATFARSLYLEDCYSLSVPLLKALGYTGVCEIEYLQDPRDNQYKLIEINARTWLWVELARQSGVDYAKIMYDYVNGANISYPRNYDIDKYWINPLSDMIYGIAGIFAGKINLKSYITSIMKKGKINALFSSSDVRPGVKYLLSIFSYLKSR